MCQHRCVGRRRRGAGRRPCMWGGLSPCRALLLAAGMGAARAPSHPWLPPLRCLHLGSPGCCHHAAAPPLLPGRPCRAPQARTGPSARCSCGAGCTTTASGSEAWRTRRWSAARKTASAAASGADLGCRFRGGQRGWMACCLTGDTPRAAALGPPTLPPWAPAHLQGEVCSAGHGRRRPAAAVHPRGGRRHAQNGVQGGARAGGGRPGALRCVLHVPRCAPALLPAPPGRRCGTLDALLPWRLFVRMRAPC